MRKTYLSPNGSHRRKGLTITHVIGSLFVIGLLIILLIPAIQSPTGKRRRPPCKNNLKQIGLALHIYHDTYGCFPPAYTVNDDGQRLHSWRTLILPYLEEQGLYDSIDFSVPWNHPTNASISTRPKCYRCLSAEIKDNETNYLALVGDNYAFLPTKGRPLFEFTDGSSNTAFIIEVSKSRAVHWMKPDDDHAVGFLLDELKQMKDTPHTGGINVLLVDGSVRYVESDRPRSEYQALITVDGGEPIEP